MRLEGQSKLGYYPTPSLSLTLIPTWLRVSSEAGLRRYLDPCCGQGEALAVIAAAHGPAETFGIELSDVRAAEAERTLNYMLNAAYEYAVLVHESFSLVLLNPPYDGENATGSGRRMEETFLLETTPRITPDGILIYIIPHHRINDKIARHLAGWYSDPSAGSGQALRCFKLAGEDYEAFDQIVVFGVRRAAYTPVSGDDLRMAQAWADAHSVIGYEKREIEEAQSDGTIKLKKIRAAVYGDLSELIEGHGEYAIPISPLKSKQGVFRFQYQPVSVVVNQHFETVLTTLDAQGNFVTATEPQQIKDLLDRYVEQLAKLVEARNVPQYDLRPEPWEWTVGGALVEEVDDGDLLGDLVRKALGQMQIGRAEGLFTIGNTPVVTQSPIGSPTAVSPALHTLAELIAKRNELLPRRLPSRRVLASRNQLTLF